jgi:hypothetical protein
MGHRIAFVVALAGDDLFLQVKAKSKDISFA